MGCFGWQLTELSQIHNKQTYKQSSHQASVTNLFSVNRQKERAWRRLFCTRCARCPKSSHQTSIANLLPRQEIGDTCFNKSLPS